jgi:hypothetical protein
MKNNYIVTVIIAMVFLSIFIGCSSTNSIRPDATIVVSVNTLAPTSPPEPTQAPTTTTVPTSTPVPTSTSIVNNCTPNNEVRDDEGDVGLPEIDIINATTSIKGEDLTVVFTLSDIPDEITINKSDVPEYNTEYVWGVGINTDGDPSTGGNSMSCQGATGYEYEISAVHFKMGDQKSGSLSSVLQNNVWKINDDGSANMYKNATLKVDPEKNTLTLSGIIPGITEKSKLCFGTSEYQSAGQVNDSVPCK